MNAPQRSRTTAFAQTWSAGLDGRSSPTHDSSVSTVRVKLIGSAEEACTNAAATALHRRPRRDTGALPGLVDRSAPPEPSHQPLAFAPTLPAIPLAELGLDREDSGVREIRHLQLRVDPSDAASRSDRSSSPTLRMAALPRRSWAGAWERWTQQSPVVAIWTVAVMCVLWSLALHVLMR